MNVINVEPRCWAATSWLSVKVEYMRLNASPANTLKSTTSRSCNCCVHS